MEFVSEQNEQVSFSITGCLEVEQVEQVKEDEQVE